jgi:hypothetical protein
VDLRRTRVRSESSLRGCPHRNQRQKSNVCLWHLAARLRRGNGVIQGKTGKEAGGVADWRLVLWYMGIVRKYNIRLAFAMVCSPA